MGRTKKQIPAQVSMKGHYKFTLTNADGSVEGVYEYDNIIPTAGRTAIANHLTSGSPSPTALRGNYIALGTGTNAPANGDTTLQTETYRKATASASNASNVGTITGFFTQTETSGTYREAGIFMGGTASANTGTLLSRVAINITKTTSQSLTIEWTITIS